MTPVIGIANKKGGVGKSSITHLFSFTSANVPIDKKVLVIDCSENKGLTYLSLFNNQSTYTIVQSDLIGVPKVLNAEVDNFELIIIDFPTHTGMPGFKTAALCCSNFIIPTGVGIMDQISTKSFLGEVEEIEKLRKAAGYETDVCVLATNTHSLEEVNSFYNTLNQQKIKHFEYGLLTDAYIAYAIEKSGPVMDYVTEGVDWTPAQHIFHNVFIEFHKQFEN